MVARWRKRREPFVLLQQETQAKMRDRTVKRREEDVRHPITPQLDGTRTLVEGHPVTPEEFARLEMAIPELISARTQHWQQLSTLGDTFTAIVIATAAVPFVQAVSASLGNTAAEGLRHGSRRALERLLQRRREAALQAISHAPRTSVEFRLVCEGTDVRVQLPLGSAEADAAALLPQLDFEAFGACKTIVYWLDGAWMAAAALPHQRPVSVRWSSQHGQWEPLHPGAELPRPPDSEDGDAASAT